MIDAQDIVELAGELSLDPSVVEKDYALGWLLAGISQHPELGPSWVFKGDTITTRSSHPGTPPAEPEGALTRASDRRAEKQLGGTC